MDYRPTLISATDLVKNFSCLTHRMNLRQVDDVVDCEPTIQHARYVGYPVRAPAVMLPKSGRPFSRATATA